MINGRDLPLVQAATGLPNMAEVVSAFAQPLRFGRVQKQIVDGLIQEIVTWTNTSGIRQPFTAQQLSILPEGQRSWKWEKLNVWADVILKPDDVVMFGSTRYRVMEKENWAEYGVIVYNICQDYENTSH